jgi:hypothetical protein
MVGDRGQLPALSFLEEARVLDPVNPHEATVVGGHRSSRLIGFSGRVELVRSDECVKIRGIVEDPAADPDETWPKPVAPPSRQSLFGDSQVCRRLLRVE